MNMRHLRDDPAIWRMLEERALALAQEETIVESNLGEELLTFQLGQDRYGVPAYIVQEVQVLANYTPLPGTPAFVLGLLNLRGRLLAVLDLRPLLGQVASPLRAGAVLLVVQANGIEVGLVADQVIEIRRAYRDLSPSFAGAEGQSLPWVRGIDPDLTVLIDLALLLADPRLAVGDTGTRGL